jgi:hypothetical protein
MKRLLPLLLAIIALALPLAAQENGGEQGFSAGLNLGSDLLPDPDTGKMASWSKLGFQPDLALGKFGIGLDLMLRFQLYPDDNTIIKIYSPDWVPSDDVNLFQGILDLYLPKLLYVRYGLRGIDPLYAKLGSINDFTLGNGLIVSNYSNMKFLPDTRLFGLQAGLDGSLFGVPYFGFEALTGNLARLDVVGGRAYVRPLAFMPSLFGKVQVGVTGVVDREPYLYSSSPQTSEPVYVIGADVTVPIVSGKAFSLVSFVEGAQEMNGAKGFVGGFGGSILSFMDYGAQLRFLQTGFVPNYFDANYDLNRVTRYKYIDATSPGDFVAGWLASLGFDLFNQRLAFNALLDGPFALIPDTASDNRLLYPHLRGSIKLAEGMIGGLYFDGSYEKYFIGRETGFFQDLISAKDAVIGFNVHYKTGSTVLTLAYTVSYVPDNPADPWDVSSSLSASVRF